MKRRGLFLSMIYCGFVAGCATSPTKEAGTNETGNLDIPLKKTEERSEETANARASNHPQEVIDWHKFFQPGPSREQSEDIRKALAAWAEEKSTDVLLKKARNETTLGLTKDAELTYRQLLRQEPEHVDAILELAQNYLKQRDLVRSFELLAQARGILEKEGEKLTGQRFKYRYILALSYLARREREQGRSILVELVAADPKFTPGYAALASSYIIDEKLDLAEFITKRGIDSGKEDQRLTNILGVIAQQRGDWQSAKRWFDKTLTLAPTYPAGLINRANLAIQRGEYEAAEGDLKKAMAFAPENEEVYTTLAVLQLKTGRVDDARASLTKSLELNPENAYARYNLGLMMSGEFREPNVALRLFHEILQTQTASDHLKGLARIHIESLKEESVLE